MKHLPLSLGMLAAFLSLTGCPPDTGITPAFLLVEDLALQTPDRGAATADISEVWAFADNVFLGAFPLPARIPVPQVGRTDIRLEAGVRQNGISATPEIYEFYTPVNRTLDLVAGESIALGVLPITYREEVRFGVFEDFEAGTPRTFTEVVVGDTTLVPTTEVVRSGTFSGKLSLSADNALVEIASVQRIRDLTATRPYVWLEVDFLSEAPVVWGITGLRGSEFVRIFDPGFREQDSWTKIYFNLSDIIVRSELEELQIIFSALKPEDRETADVYLDNVKLLYF